MNQDRRMYQTNKRKKWPWITGILLAVAIMAFFLMSRGTRLAVNNTQSVTAEKGSLAVTVIGTGNLEYDETIDIQIPSGIVIKDVLADVGDTVLKGDVLAEISAVSLKTEIDSVKSQISDMDKQINSAKNIAETEAVKTQVSGRVKKIYAEQGDAALDVLINSGALMVLSLDGKMAVDFEGASGLIIGDKVDVVLENGDTREGTVVKTGGGNYTVTLTDNGPKPDERVTIENKDGDTLGAGALYINRPIGIIAAYGNIRTIHVSENDRVSSGRTLITLDDLPVPPRFEQLLADREVLLEKLKSLLALSKTNTLTANADGVIMSVNIEAGKTAAVSADTGGSTLGGSPSGSAAADGTSNSKESMVTAFTAALNENVVLSVNVDELDILSIQNDMDVDITFDAISGQTFYGKIVHIADSAKASGGVAKFSVKVLIPKDISMRVGMNATATVLVDEKNDIVMIPIAALQESGGRVFVYTKRDADTGRLSGEVDVTTGISDGINAEITSGLSEGSTVYYMITARESEDIRFGPPGGFGGNRGRAWD